MRFPIFTMYEVLHYTDDQLIAMIRSGDGNARDAALVHIYRSGFSAVKGRIRKSGGDPEDALDMMGEAIVILDNHVRNFKYVQTASLKNYFVGICYWTWRSKNGIRQRNLLPGDTFDFDGADFITPLVLMLEDEQKEMVRNLLHSEDLGERCREALTLHSLSYPLDEIALAMKTTYGYAQQMVFRCRNKLRAILEKHPALLKQLLDML